MKKIILSGGGTGGHIYPAVAVAQALKSEYGDQVKILFVGAEGRMEMQKIPALGYDIVGLPIAGLQRRLDWHNIEVPFRLMKSISKAKRVIKEFDADLVIGFGGYASAPVLWAAQRLGIPTIIQEQNSFAGLTNKILAKRVKHICVAYAGMERFFPSSDITLTGNPLRGTLGSQQVDKKQALEQFGLDDSRPVVLVVGGSLGTRTLNEVMKRWIADNPSDRPIQMIWQTGKYYEKEMLRFAEQHSMEGIWQGAFIERMDLAYAAASLVVSRSGACTVSELCLLGKATIFVPSPNVAEDHQTCNARALSDKGAALMVTDAAAVGSCIERAIELIGQPDQLKAIELKAKALATPNAAADIVKIAKKYLE
ncbi:MAG: undecaprenyldiphospho-muramoylpentapeptide beta-N-acetylglucosaminyltransferase [Rikenellaceae bacterium]